jgi:hypothetical protein
MDGGGLKTAWNLRREDVHTTHWDLMLHASGSKDTAVASVASTCTCVEILAPPLPIVVPSGGLLRVGVILRNDEVAGGEPGLVVVSNDRWAQRRQIPVPGPRRFR